MITSIKKPLSKSWSNRSYTSTPLITNSEVIDYISKTSILHNEMLLSFYLEQIVETFWITTDLYDILEQKNNLTFAELNLSKALNNWSRDKNGFCRAEPNKSCTLKNVYIGGNLGYASGLVIPNSLNGLEIKPLDYYCETDHYEYLGNVYKNLFTEVVYQFKSLLIELQVEQNNL